MFELSSPMPKYCLLFKTCQQNHPTVLHINQQMTVWECVLEMPQPISISHAIYRGCQRSHYAVSASYSNQSCQWWLCDLNLCILGSRQHRNILFLTTYGSPELKLAVLSSPRSHYTKTNASHNQYGKASGPAKMVLFVESSYTFPLCWHWPVDWDQCAQPAAPMGGYQQPRKWPVCWQNSAWLAG